jgi:hypothetical protein
MMEITHNHKSEIKILTKCELLPLPRLKFRFVNLSLRMSNYSAFNRYEGIQNLHI